MSKQQANDVPDIIYDHTTKKHYKRGKYYGKGGFAKCYEILDLEQGGSYAGKIVSKKLMTKSTHKEKMIQEIKIHQSLKHKNVVGFYSFFDDSANMYMVLELCRKRSMMELHKRRKALTELETRYYMKQIVHGVAYLHGKQIIHRDLKLGNLFLDDQLIVKIGDFGLATVIEFDGERKKTLCGTPNYIAPEILTKKGHSFEVDVWSIGCIMYALLLGRAPFESDSLKETYAKITKCDYQLASNISNAAKSMIMLTLQPNPKDRPNINELEVNDFFYSGVTPSSLPLSCLTMAPRFDQLEKNPRTPLVTLNGEPMNIDTPQKLSNQFELPHAVIPPFQAKENFLNLREKLAEVLRTVRPNPDYKFSDEMCDPEAQPLIWVSKWVDYSDKYGFGYQLCDDSVGVMFNDTTKLILLANGVNVHYVQKTGEEVYMTMSSYSKIYEKKIKLLSYFHKYMREHLMKAGGFVETDTDSLSRIPHLHQWCRSTTGVLLQLNNGTVQINFSDHTKFILCPLMSAITCMDEDKSFKTFRFSKLKNNLCPTTFYDKMKYAHDKITLLLQDV